jgi:hypothetical protein
MNEMKDLWHRWGDDQSGKEGHLLDGLLCQRLQKHGTEMLRFYMRSDLPFHTFKRGDLVQFHRTDEPQDTYQGTVYERGRRHLMVVSRDDPGNVAKDFWCIMRGFSSLSYEK